MWFGIHAGGVKIHHAYSSYLGHTHTRMCAVHTNNSWSDALLTMGRGHMCPALVAWGWCEMCMVHMASPMCIQYKDSPWIFTVSWTCINSRAPRKLYKGMTKRTAYDSKQPSTPRISNLIWPGMFMGHCVRLICTGDEDTQWILAVSWSTQSSCTCMKHPQTHSYGNVDA